MKERRVLLVDDGFEMARAMDAEIREARIFIAGSGAR